MTNITLDNYPDLRDLTRSISRNLQVRIANYLEVTQTHFRPAPVFGPHLASGSKAEHSKNAGEAFAQFRANFKQIAASAQLNIEPALPDAIDINFATPVLSAFLYDYPLPAPGGTRRVTITAPFRFVLAYPDYSFSELRNLVGSRGSKDTLQRYVLHFAVLNYVTMQNKKLLSLFDDLRFPIRSECAEEFGPLPLTIIEAPAGAVRPPDNVVTQVCKFLGANAAEEVVDLDAWNKLPDPLEDWFRAEAATFGVELQAS
jgi:hypothetical protein